MRREIRVRDTVIGEGRPLFVMAECGVTCNYDVEITTRLIDAVRAAGADAIKLILWFPDEIMSDRSVRYRYETVDGPREENMYEMLNRLRFTLDQWREIKRYADRQGVILFATVNSPSGIVWAEALGLEAYKLSSWDYTDAPLWRAIAQLGKPMLIDTGPVNAVEVARAIQLMQDAGNDQSVLVHCYHTGRVAEMNMRAIPYLRETFQTLVGFSAKDRDATPDIMAVTLGAVVLEKRLTVSRKMPGHHHILSMEPEEFTGYVRLMRSVHSALGEEALIPSRADLSERRKWFRHLAARAPIPKGAILTPELLGGKRPEAGISPELLDAFVGKPVRRDLAENDPIRWEDV
ncbi:MAG: N-acetylneuraminate synthase family protein [Candidatus Omnitrophica bacterium]|nr:N-acetylneuraminate synthase family protein [Candidatus Omnitrophota bacterium]